MEKSEHNKIMSQVANEILKPAGLIRKGQSRTWLDDNGWFTTIFEYQPSAWSRGSYLNVGINFNWYPQEDFSFDYGYRESDFVEAKSDDLFYSKMVELTHTGLKKVFEYRNFADIKYAKKHILSYKFHSDELWGNYHRAMICLMTYDSKGFQKYCAEIEKISRDIEWIQSLQKEAKHISLLCKNKDQGIDYLSELIIKTRLLKKLPTTDKTILRQTIIKNMDK